MQKQMNNKQLDFKRPVYADQGNVTINVAANKKAQFETVETNYLTVNAEKNLN